MGATARTTTKLTDDRLARLESVVAALLLAGKQIQAAVEALNENDRRLAKAIESLHNRLLLQEAGTAVYEISQDRSLN